MQTLFHRLPLLILQVTYGSSQTSLLEVRLPLSLLPLFFCSDFILQLQPRSNVEAHHFLEQEFEGVSYDHSGYPSRIAVYPANVLALLCIEVGDESTLFAYVNFSLVRLIKQPVLENH